MSAEKRGNEAPLSGLFLLFIGTVLLLQTLDVLPWALWNTLWRFWPVLLIMTGLGILLRRYDIRLVSLLILALLFGSLLLAIWQSQEDHSENPNAKIHPSSFRGRTNQVQIHKCQNEFSVILFGI